MKISRSYSVFFSAILVIAMVFSIFSSIPSVQAQAIATPTPKVEPQIVGGTLADPGEYPWQVVLVDSSASSIYTGQFCGGSLVSSQWVLTAAHCITEDDGSVRLLDSLYVVAGIWDIEFPAAGYQQRDVLQIVRHPAYVDALSYDNDIALLKLSSPVLIGGSGATRTDIIPLVPDDVGGLAGNNSWVTGWGDTSYGGNKSAQLREVELPIIDNFICNDAEHHNGSITDNMLCAGYDEGGSDSCQGDSGGPLIVWDAEMWKLAGVVSWGESCALPYRQGVYTRVSQYVDWINSYLTPSTPQGDIVRVSVDSSGIEGNSQSNSPSISADGRYVALASEADNLVDGDINGMSDIFVYDLQTGTVILASVDSNGIQGNGPSRKPSLSADGRYVAFSSSSTNLDDEIQNGIVGIFIRDLYMGTTHLISGGINNEAENCGSDDPSVSGNGRYIAFESCSSNLISDDTNDRYDIFVRDLTTQAIRRVSWSLDGYERVSDSKNPSISANGRYVGYYIPYGWSGGTDYVYDTLLHATIEIGRSSFEDRPALSADGRYIAYSSHTDVGGIGGYTLANISIYDQNVGTSYPITDGSKSYDPSISLDGRYVTFSSSDQFALEDTNYSKDIYKYDLVEGTTTLVSVAVNGTSGNHDSDGISPVSTDGRYIVFSSYASDLVDGDTNGMEDVFLNDRNIFASLSISGRVVDTSNNSIAGVSIADSVGHYAVTDSNGNYTLNGLADGSYLITPSKSGFVFSPASSLETVPPDITGLNFVGTVETQNPNCIIQTDIPRLECEALVALYNSTEGANWTNNTGWLQTNTPCDWYGVNCADGHVTQLILHDNNLSGPIPSQLANLSGLTGLWLYDNHLTGVIPPQLGNLVNLTELALYINQLSGSIPVELGNLTKLEWLNLSRNQLTGPIPSVFGNLTQLQGLYLFSNQLTGSIPVELGNLVNLGGVNFGGLILSNNQLTGSIPPELGNLTNLYELNLSGNQLTGFIPQEIGNLTALQILDLHANQLNGPIPSQLGNLSNLMLLHLGSNHLTGSIPAQLGNLTNLTNLYLDNNQLTGSIPTQLGNLLDLFQISLAYNQLSGPIPSELGNLANLRLLALEDNQLSGPIPSELGSLTSLQWLTLKDNHLSGEFPSSTTSLVNLYMLTFDCWITSSDPAVIAFVENLVPGWQDRVCLQSVAPEGAPVASAASVDFTVTFSEPVTGVDPSDFSPFMTGDLSGASILGVTGGPASYTVAVDTGAGNGALRLDIVDDDTILDLDGNPLGGPGLGNGNYTGGQTYAIIKTPTFGDVSTSYWSWGFIERLYNAGVTGGCSTNPVKYCPETNVTRGQMAVFLLRGMYGQAYVPPAATGTVFNDVPAGHMFGSWIEQLAAEGITGGCGGGNYCPNSPVTREQMAVFLLVAKHGVGYTPPAASGVFADVSAANAYAPWIEQLAAEGITGGCGGGKYCPKQVVNRAQMAVFLVKAFSLP